MADVLLGRTEGLDGFQRHVVLKRIRPEHAHDERFIRMLLAEARVAATLHHHNIVQVHDVGEDAGEYFLAMEYLHGEDLRTILARAAKQRVHVPLDHALAIVSAAAAGLHYAHERRDNENRPLGIVHRDISPSNLLISYDGSVKILDFGIAKAIASASEETHSGALRGKISYMSPEQCRGDRVDRRSDIYSLGVVLYELTTTKRLFKGESNYRVMESIVNGQIVEPRTRRPELPAKLSELIMRALATDPERRFATAEELRVALDQLGRRLGWASDPPAIAAYMREQFGERPEPWVNLNTSPQQQHSGLFGLPSRTDEPFQAFSTSSPWQTGPIPTPASREGAPTARPASERYVSEQPPPLPPPPALEPSMGAQRGAAGPRPVAPGVRRSGATKALIAAPLLLVLGFVVWQLASSKSDTAAVVAATAPAASAPPAPAAPTPSATPPAEPPPSPTPQTAVHMPPIAEIAESRPKQDAAARELARAKARGETDATKRSETDAPKRVEADATKRSETDAPKRAATVKRADSSSDPSPASAPAPESSATPPPVEPPAPAPAPAPVRVEPAPPPAPPTTAALVALDANRIGGDKNIVPDDLTQTEVRRRGTERLIGIYKICITASGDINSVSQVKSTGFAAYDKKIQTTIRSTWRYRPFLVNGQASPVCTAVQLAYVAHG